MKQREREGRKNVGDRRDGRMGGIGEGERLVKWMQSTFLDLKVLWHCFWQLECIYAIWCAFLPIYVYNYLKLMLIEWLFFFFFLASIPISGTRMVEGNLWRQNRTSSRKLCCLPLILFSGWQYLHGIHGNNITIISAMILSDTDMGISPLNET